MSTGGADLPAQIEALYDEMAATAAAAGEAEALRAEGAGSAERVAREVREAFTLATGRHLLAHGGAGGRGPSSSRCAFPELPLRTTHDRAARDPSVAREPA